MKIDNNRAFALSQEDKFEIDFSDESEIMDMRDPYDSSNKVEEFEK